MISSINQQKKLRIKNNKGRYSSGRRGGPAKAVGRATGARVQIPLFPPKNCRLNSNDNFLL